MNWIQRELEEQVRDDQDFCELLHLLQDGLAEAHFRRDEQAMNKIRFDLRRVIVARRMSVNNLRTIMEEVRRNVSVS